MLIRKKMREIKMRELKFETTAIKSERTRHTFWDGLF